MEKEHLKIGYVLDDGLDSTDGVQQYVLTVGNWMKEQGHEVHYLVGETHRTDIENVHSLARNIGVRFNGNRMSIPLRPRASEIERVVQDTNFDVLHFQLPHGPLGHEVIKTVGKTSPETALAGTFHILPLTGLHRLGNRALAMAQRRDLKRLDEVVSVSSAAQAFADKTYNLPSSILPNVVDLERFAKGEKREDMAEGKNIVFLGRLVERKGCMNLLQAIAYLQQHSPTVLEGVTVTVCGKGKLQEQLEAYTAEQGLTELVKFAGFVDEADKPDYLASADIAIFPSLGGESFGIVLIEAMAAGAGVTVGNNNPGYSTVLGEFPESLFDATDIPALAQLLAYFLSHPEAAKELHDKQTLAVKKYGIEAVGPELIRMYQRAIVKHPHAVHNRR